MKTLQLIISLLLYPLIDRSNIFITWYFWLSGNKIVKCCFRLAYQGHIYTAGALFHILLFFCIILHINKKKSFCFILLYNQDGFFFNCHTAGMKIAWYTDLALNLASIISASSLSINASVLILKVLSGQSLSIPKFLFLYSFLFYIYLIFVYITSLNNLFFM